jgi:hypothetical protein
MVIAMTCEACRRDERGLAGPGSIPLKDDSARHEAGTVDEAGSQGAR